MSFSTRKTTRPVRSSFASTSSTFSSGSIFQNRSPPHVYETTTTTSASSVRFSFDNINNRSISPSRSISSVPKKTCMCSPTSHPGSFRCSLHKFKNSNSNNISKNNHHNMNTNMNTNTNKYPSNRLNARRSAMTNSLVRIGTVEGGDLVKRALAALIRPSCHQQRRRSSFQRKPSRLSVMSKAENV